MKKEPLVIFLKGLWVGGTMTVPGVSGGTMAIVMGVYDRLVHSISCFFQEPKKSILFLLEFAVGGMLGVIAFARLITMLLQNSVWGTAVEFFFVGAVAAGLPLIVRESKVEKVNWKVLICIAVGILLVVGIAQIPDGAFQLDQQVGAKGVLMQVLCGFVVAIALVFPGISASQMLYMFGIYDVIMNEIGNLNFVPLIPLAVGLFLGIILTTKLIERLIQVYPKETYMVILGFVVASVWELFPGFVEFLNIRCILLGIAGFVVVYFFSSRELSS